jgi:hypothetical protein
VLAPLCDARLTVAVGEVALVLVTGPDADAGVAALLDCAAGRRRPSAGAVAWMLAPAPLRVLAAATLRAAVRDGGPALPADRPLLVVDARRAPGPALGALLHAASAGRAVLAAARIDARPDALAPALARAMLGAAALLRARAAASTAAGGPRPCVALWTLADGRLRLHARVASAGGGSVARSPGPS